MTRKEHLVRLQKIQTSLTTYVGTVKGGVIIFSRPGSSESIKDKLSSVPSSKEDVGYVVRDISHRPFGVKKVLFPFIKDFGSININVVEGTSNDLTLNLFNLVHQATGVIGIYHVESKVFISIQEVGKIIKLFNTLNFNVDQHMKIDSYVKLYFISTLSLVEVNTRAFIEG